MSKTEADGQPPFAEGSKKAYSKLHEYVTEFLTTTMDDVIT